MITEFNEKNISYFTESDKLFLTKNLLSHFSKPIVCAEVGNWTGNSTRFFASSIPKDSIFYSVDLWEHDIDVPDTVIRVNSCSLKWNTPDKLDFIYLDGNHYTGHVIKEIDKFSKVTNIIAGHDRNHVSYALYKQFKKTERHYELLLDNQCQSWIMKIL